MTAIGEAFIRITPDAKGFERSLSQDMDSKKGFLGGVGKKVGGFIKVGLLGAVAGIGAGAVIGKSLVDDASNLAESVSKIGVVFTDQAKDIEKWASTSAIAFGQSKQQALEAAGTYGTLFQAFGVGRSEAASMSKSMVELAADLASFNNVSIDEALTALQSGITGETEPLKKFGIVLSDVRLKEQALAMGLIASTKDALTPAAKAQASYALIMKDTSLAQGDFARTSDGVANKQRIVGAQFLDLKTKLGTALLPAFGSLLGVTRELIGGFSAFGAAFSSADGQVTSSGLAGFMERLGFAAREVFDVFKAEGLGGALALIGEKIGAAWPAIQLELVEIGKGILDQLEEWGRQFLLWIEPKIVPMLDELLKMLTAMGTWFTTVAQPAIITKLEEWGDAFVEWIGPKIVPMLGELLKMLTAVGVWFITVAQPAMIKNGIDLGLALLRWTLSLGGDMIGGLAIAFADLAGKVPGWVADFARWGWDMGSGLVGTIIDWVTGLPGAIAGAFASLASEMVGFGANMGRSLVNGIISIWNRASLKMPRIDVPSWVPGIGGKGFGGFDVFPNVSPLASGGVITRPTFALIGETSRSRPEIVTPERLMRQVIDQALKAHSPTAGAGPTIVLQATYTDPNPMEWVKRAEFLAGAA